MPATLKARKPTEVEPGHIKGVLFGGPGAGKTWTALAFPTPYYIDTEGGADLAHYTKRLNEAGGAYLGPEDGSCDLDLIADQVIALATTKHGFKTLVIDSITKPYLSEIQRESERLGEKDVFGASKKPAYRKVRRLLYLLDRLDMNVWLVAHEVAEWQSVNGQRQEVGRIPDIYEKVSYELDLALRVQKHGDGYRTASVHKTRLLGFPDGDRFDLQKNGKDVSYTAFAERYGREWIEAAPKTAEIVNAETVSEIRRLLEAVRVSEEDFEKMLSRAKADRIEDLAAEHGAKLLSWLRAKVEKNGKEKES